MNIHISENDNVKLYDAQGNEKEVVVVTVLPECEGVLCNGEYTTNVKKIFGLAEELGDKAPYIFVRYDYPAYLTVGSDITEPCSNVKIFPAIDDLALSKYEPVMVSLCKVIVSEVHVESVQIEKGTSLLQLAQALLVGGYTGTYRIHRNPTLWEVKVSKEFNDVHFYGCVWDFNIKEAKCKTCYTTCNNAILHPEEPSELWFLDVEMDESFDYEEEDHYDESECIWF